eukprot:scaffold226447_cov19-Tisochrysis_lutea.AAC.4
MGFRHRATFYVSNRLPDHTEHRIVFQLFKRSRMWKKLLNGTGMFPEHHSPNRQPSMYNPDADVQLSKRFCVGGAVSAGGCTRFATRQRPCRRQSTGCSSATQMRLP